MENKHKKIAWIVTIVILIIAIGFVIYLYFKTNQEITLSHETIENNQKVTKKKDNKKQNNVDIEKFLPNKVTGLMGTVKDINVKEKIIKVEFGNEDKKWISDVSINKNTYLGVMDDPYQETLPIKTSEAKLSDLVKEGKVLVRSNVDIINLENFEATKIIKIPKHDHDHEHEHDM